MARKFILTKDGTPNNNYVIVWRYLKHNQPQIWDATNMWCANPTKRNGPWLMELTDEQAHAIFGVKLKPSKRRIITVTTEK